MKTGISRPVSAVTATRRQYRRRTEHTNLHHPSRYFQRKHKAHVSTTRTKRLAVVTSRPERTSSGDVQEPRDRGKIVHLVLTYPLVCEKHLFSIWWIRRRTLACLSKGTIPCPFISSGERLSWLTDLISLCQYLGKNEINKCLLQWMIHQGGICLLIALARRKKASTRETFSMRGGKQAHN